jgi:hypothetical protein
MANDSIRTLCRPSALKPQNNAVYTHHHEREPNDIQSYFSPKRFGRVLEKLSSLAYPHSLDKARTYNLTDCLSSRLDSAPGRDVFASDDGRASRGHLSDEAFIGNDASVEVDLCG